MESVKNQITDFLNKCNEVRSCKFIMATTKIKDLLKSIVNSEELYDVFNTVASKFDYVAAKEQCFKEADEFSYGRSRVVLPDTVGDRLAFIFCLLVEIDRGEIQINAFLQKFYPKDGSYFASYQLFCDEIIGNLENIISDIFAQDLAEPSTSVPEEVKDVKDGRNVFSPNPALSGLINGIETLIAGELDFIASGNLAEEDKEAAAGILTQLGLAVREGDAPIINALTYGYNYFIMYTKAVSEGVGGLFNAIGEYVSSL